MDLVAFFCWPWSADTWAAGAQVVSAVFVPVALLVAIRQLRATHRAHAEQMAVAERLDEAQTRPYVVVDLEFNGRQLAHVHIANTGRTAARNVRCAFDPPLRSAALDDIDGVPKVADFNVWRNIPVLPPGKTVAVLLDTGPARYETRDTDDPLPDTYQVRVEYESDVLPDRVYQSDQVLDFSWLWGMGKVDDFGMHELVKQVKKIVELLKKRS